MSVKDFLGLKKFAQYSVTVTAINSEGKGPSSEAVSIRTLEDGMHILAW